MQIDCLLSPADIAAVAPGRFEGAVCVVFDVLRATSTIVTAMAHGCEAVHPVATIEDAQAMRREWPGAKLAGERHGDPIPGFDFGNSPIEFTTSAPARLITTTTNGTIALRACAGAEAVLAASLLNLAAVAAWIEKSGARNLLMVCAGTFETTALEDIYGAGKLIESIGSASLTDAAWVARNVAGRYGDDGLGALTASRNGQVLRANGRGAEVEFCSQRDLFSIVPILEQGVLSCAENARCRNTSP